MATITEPIPLRSLLVEPALRSLHFDLVAGEGGIEHRRVANPRIQKPGLALAGFLPYVKDGRIQILGESEFAYLETLGVEEAACRINAIVDRDVPAIIATKGNLPPEAVLKRCDERQVAFLVTRRQTSDTIEVVSAFLEEAPAPRIQMHGVLLDVFSLGTLIVGDAGIGKSECALELIYRGHRLVADDLVVVRRTHNHGLTGSPHSLIQNYLELRGVGIIDVRKHFGMTAASSSVKISLVIELVKLNSAAREMEQAWRESVMERPHAWTSTQEILGVDIPKYTMAVAPGRDVALMVETAVRKCILATRGVTDEREFLDAVNRIAAGDTGEEPT
jgi:HPr kinase/phosphorylase